MSQSLQKFRNFNNLVNVLFLEVSDNVTVLFKFRLIEPSVDDFSGLVD